MNATYSGIYVEPVTLTAGGYEGRPYVVGDPARPTLQYSDGSELYGDLDGQISGFGGCNSYTSSFRLGESNLFVMTAGPLTATEKACPDPVKSQENAYFTVLDRVSQRGYEFGRLAMYYPDRGGELGRLLFTPYVPTENSQIDIQNDQP